MSYLAFCETCNIFITVEHGGIVCDNCDSIFCCSDECVGESIMPLLEKGVNVSQRIPTCKVCAEPTSE